MQQLELLNTADETVNIAALQKFHNMYWNWAYICIYACINLFVYNIYIYDCLIIPFSTKYQKSLWPYIQHTCVLILILALFIIAKFPSNSNMHQ